MGRFTATDAVRLDVKARIGLTGVTNGGKTYSALEIAKGLLEAEGCKDDWSKVAIIDTERRRSLFYADNGEFGKFKFIDFQPPYNPQDYVEAVEYAESLGCLVIIIDSLSHAWNGTGGLLEYVADKTANSRSKNGFNEGWGGKDGGTAVQNRMIDRILSSKAHIIATFRQKMEYVQENDGQKTSIKKVGVKPIQRDDLEYEFDITLKLNNDHSAEIIKNTVEFIKGQGETIERITPEFGLNLGKYLKEGVSADEIIKKQVENVKNQINDFITKKPDLKSIWTIYSNKSFKEENDLDILNEIYKNMKECM